MSLIESIKETIGLSDSTEIGCRAVVDEESGDLCDGPSWGRGFVDGHEIKYCMEHAPSDAASAHAGGTPVSRSDAVVFYIPEDETTIEVE